MTLRSPIRDLLEGNPKAEERTIRRAQHRLWASLDEHSKSHSLGRGRKLRLGLVEASAVALIGLVIAIFADSSTDGPLRLADGSAAQDLVSDDAPLHADFSDGSAVDISSMSEVRFVQNDARHIDLTLVGEAEFDIRPRGPRRWTIDMGELQVQVVGTRFVLMRGTSLLRVTVSRGAVQISGSVVGPEPRLLRAGESAEFPLTSIEPTPDAAREPTATAPEDREPNRSELRDEHRNDTAIATTDWRSLVREGNHRGAFEILENQGFSGEVDRAPNADVLFELADAARLSDHPSEATAPLSRIVTEFPNTPRAAIAAFTLGRLYAESLERPSEAARAFEQALVLGLPAALQESAAARRMQLWSLAQQPSRAHEAACTYLETYPSGPVARSARELCDETAGELEELR